MPIKIQVIPDKIRPKVIVNSRDNLIVSFAYSNP